MLETMIRKANLNDVFIVVITSLAIVGFWRGTWNIMDKYLLPNNFLLSQLASIIFGIVILILIAEYEGKEK